MKKVNGVLHNLAYASQENLKLDKTKESAMYRFPHRYFKLKIIKLFFTV
jgi:hypothetical protein